MSDESLGWQAQLLYLGLILFWALVAWIGPPQGDFANYWTAAHLWSEGSDLSHLYDYRWFTEQATRLGFGDQLVGFAVLSPPSALLMAPLLPLGLAGAKLAWMVGQGMCALGIAAVLCRWLNRPLWMGPLFLLGATPILRAHLVQGQMHLPVVLLLCFALWAWMSRRDLWAGVCLGLVIGLKIHAWPLIPIAMLARRWMLLVWTLLTLIIGGGFSVLLMGWEVHQIWLTEIAPAAARGAFIDPWNVAFQSPGHAIRTLTLSHPVLNPGSWMHQPALAHGLPVALQVLIVGLTLIPALSWRRLDCGERQRLLGAASICALLSGPLLASYHLVLVIPAVAIGAHHLDKDDRLGRSAAVIALGLLLCWWPVPSDWPDSHWLIPLALPRFWILLGIWALLLSSQASPWSRGFWDVRPFGVLLAALLMASFASREQRTVDAAKAVDIQGMPLIASDLMRSPDGSIWFSGMPNRGDPKYGWIGYRLLLDDQEVQSVAMDEENHVWSPRLAKDGIAWTMGAGADLNLVESPCLGGVVKVVETDLGPQIGLVDAQSKTHILTWARAHYSHPICDEDRDRVWFLSDRGVGVRAMRLWWTPLREPQ